MFIVQSKVQNPEYCSERTKSFIKEKFKDLKEISDEEFNTLIKSQLVEETKKDNDLNEQFKRNWDEIAIERFKFNVKEENAEYLKKCTKEGLIKFYEKYLINEGKVLDVEYVCGEHWEENENKLKEENKYQEYNIHKRIIFDKISDFHDCNSLYPCISNSYYREYNS